MNNLLILEFYSFEPSHTHDDVVFEFRLFYDGESIKL